MAPYMPHCVVKPFIYAVIRVSPFAPDFKALLHIEAALFYGQNRTLRY